MSTIRRTISRASRAFSMATAELSANCVTICLVAHGERHDAAVLVLGVDQLQDARRPPRRAPAGGTTMIEWRPVVGLSVERGVKGVRNVALDVVDVVDHQRLAGGGRVARERLLVHGKPRKRVHVLVDRALLVEQRVVLHVGEVEVVAGEHVDGPGVGVGEAPGLVQHPLEQRVEVLDAGDVRDRPPPDRAARRREPSPAAPASARARPQRDAALAAAPGGRAAPGAQTASQARPAAAEHVRHLTPA